MTDQSGHEDHRPIQVASGTAHRSTVWWLLLVLIAAGVLVNGYRGPWRALVEHGARWDWGLVYSMSRAWLLREDPYDPAGVLYAWLDGRGPLAQSPLTDRTHVLLYPPTTLAALSPLAALRFGASEVAWMVLNLALYGASLWAVARLGRLRGTWQLGFLAMGAWLAPVGTGMRVGQTGVVTFGLLALGGLAVGRARRTAGDGWWAGLMMGLASAIKPQLGLPFVVYEAGRRRWRLFVTAAVVLGGLAGLGLWQLEASRTPWLTSWRQNLHEFPISEDGNPTRGNTKTRHHMLNLHYPLHEFMDDRRVVSGLVWGLVAMPCAAYLVIDLRDQRRRGRLARPGSVEGRGELLSLAMVAAASLLVVYHRSYDGVAILFAMGLGTAGLMRGERRHWVTLALCLPFLAPGPVMLVDAAKHGVAPERLTGSSLWHGVLVSHQVWALYAMLWWGVWLRLRPARTHESGS